MRLAEYEAGICGCGSGLPIGECVKDQTFLVEHTVHFGKRALEKVMRSEEENAEKAQSPKGWNDGWMWHVKVHRTDDDAD